MYYAHIATSTHYLHGNVILFHGVDVHTNQNSYYSYIMIQMKVIKQSIIIQI